MRAFGPVQILVIGFQNPTLKGEILAELNDLRARDLVRLVDLVVVAKGCDGLLWSVEATDLGRDEAVEFGAIASALVGLGSRDGVDGGTAHLAIGMRNGRVFTDDEVWHIADAIPPGRTAAIALLEHSWATPLRASIARAGGTVLADTWLRQDGPVSPLDHVVGRPERPGT